MGIAVDDFGTGYSNWTYLRDLPITAIKLDQSFTRDLAGSPKAQSVSQAVIGLASQLGYRVVAEGIETHDTIEDMLRYVHLSPEELMTLYRDKVAGAKLTARERNQYLDALRLGLTRSAYLS